MALTVVYTLYGESNWTGRSQFAGGRMRTKAMKMAMAMAMAMAKVSEISMATVSYDSLEQNENVVIHHRRT